MTFDVSLKHLFPDWFPGSNFAIKVLEMNCLTLDELRAKNFLYKLFNWSVQAKQLSLGQSFIHASALIKDNSTIAILGEGGVGKTTTHKPSERGRSNDLD